MANIFRIFFIFQLTILYVGTFAATIDSLPDTAKAQLRVAHLYYNGNHVTKVHIIQMISGLDTGMIYDSLMIKRAKQRLEATGLFLKIAILSLRKNNAMDLYIVVKEPYYFGINDLDFTPFTSRHGQSGKWYCPFIGLENSNVGGSMETVRLSLRFWEWRTAALSWSKPLLPSRYFIGCGALVDARPDNALPLDRLEYLGSVTAGRRLFERSKVYCSVIPDYQRTISWTATEKDTTNYYQAFGVLGWFTDRRSSGYDPSSGWSFFFDTRSNFIYHEITTPRYVQFTSDIKAYYPGLFDGHKAAFRFNIVARTNDAGIQNRLVLGGIGSVRGYANSGIDLRSTCNSSFFFSSEYRFPIYQFPSISPVLPGGVSKVFARFVGDLTDLIPRIDGALILDYGRIARDMNRLLAFNGPEYMSGADFGFGIRVMEPTMRRTVCLDIVWPENPLLRKTCFYPAPSWCLYLDLSF
ncbi:MAG: BamA/TamA family outer membrane protein [Chitinispirillaceae bacterium]